MATLPDTTVTICVDASPAICSVRVALALADLIEFVDGLTYEQLDHVPGLFAATRKARTELAAATGAAIIATE